MLNRAQHGFTLIELLVGTAIATVLTAAAFTFAAHETRLMGVSRERVELSQAGRAALDLIVEDVSQAGAGIGYGVANGNHTELNAASPCPGGATCFRGLVRGPFTIRNVGFNTGGATFPMPTGAGPAVMAGTQQTFAGVGHGGLILPNYNITSQAVGIRMANGSFASIVSFEGGAEYCLDNPAIGVQTSFQDGELVVLRHQDGIQARSAIFRAQAGPCVNSPGACANGCQQFVDDLDPDLTFTAYDQAYGSSYRGGEIQGGLKTVVWFIAPNAQTRSGTLSRAVFDSSNCTGAAPNINTCAGIVAEYTEFLGMRVWAWNTAAVPPAWQFVGDGPIPGQQRLRVDVELVIRSRVPDVKPRAGSVLQLTNECVPMPCGTNDHGDRRVYRTSVEITNSGRMALPR